MGIGGAGVSSLAELLLAEGLAVSGCDVAPSATTARLQSLGMDIRIGHSPEHLEGVDLIGYSSAVPKSHPELMEAARRGIKAMSRAELLGDVSRFKWGIAVGGTHGKTTTTSLTGFIMTRAGLDPTVVVGGRVHFLGAHARLGRSEYLVCEADEFDRSFLKLWPVVSVVTNIEAEHLDTYGNVRELERAFEEFAGRVPFFGAAVACLDDPGVRGLLPRLQVRKITYGLTEGAEIRGAQCVLASDRSHCRVLREGHDLGELSLQLPGRHMLQNALAATAVALHVGIDFGLIAEAVGAFTGVARRFERKGERGGVTVIDDYAHHPTELAATLAAARQRYPGARLLAVFQPHLFSRTQAFARDFGEALLAADAAIILPIYASRETAIPGVSHELVVEEGRKAGHSGIRTAGSFVEVLGLLDSLTRPGDVVLTVGAGDVVNVGEQWLAGAVA
jgi:UDP-N-acetylmuramate--alanine ligase